MQELTEAEQYAMWCECVVAALLNSRASDPSIAFPEDPKEA